MSSISKISKMDGLDEFERTLAAEKAEREKEASKERSKHRLSRHRSRSRSPSRRHRSERHEGDRERDKDSHRHKRRHHDDPRDDEERRRRHRRDRDRSRSQERLRDTDEKEDRDGERHRRHEKTSDPKADFPIPDEETTDAKAIKPPRDVGVRDSWMTEPSAMDFDYTQKGARKEEKHIGGGAREVLDLKMHRNELNRHLLDVRNEQPGRQEMVNEQEMEDAGQQEVKEVDYEFGDSGAQWRMTKLKAVYREAEETKRPIEDVATERLGSLKEFDDAREEETELERRKLYGSGYVGKVKPSGELHEERKQAMSIKRACQAAEENERIGDLPQGQIVDDQAPTVLVTQINQSKLNYMRAALMKAQLMKKPNAPQLQREYDAARAAFDAQLAGPETVVLGEMEARLLAGTRGEVVPITNKRGLERGLVKENEDMSIEDMVREERRTRNVAGGEGRKLAKAIGQDSQFENDLDYIDDNVEKLAKTAPKSMTNLKNMAIGEFQKMNRVLESCQLCHHEDKNLPPVAPILALGTRVYLTLPTQPELSEGGAVIVPIQHRTNLLECDDDEWEEIRNFQKCLTQMYCDQGRDVVFYENAAVPHRKGHAAMMAVPLPYELGEVAPAFFKEAIVGRDFTEKSQHKKIYDTNKLARTDVNPKMVFRRTLAKEMPYFHVWFDLNGGLGHIVESEDNWPKGDLFAREVIGGMLDVEPDVIRRQGRWQRGGDPRINDFKKRFKKFDWTRVLTGAE